MKIEIDPTRIIKETRLEKHVFTLSHCELEFIVKHKALKAEEKLLWLLLASMSTEDENLSSKREISSSCLVDSLQQLEAMSFLNRYSDNRKSVVVFRCQTQDCCTCVWQRKEKHQDG